MVLPGGDRVDYVVDARNRRVGRKKNGTYTSKYLYLDQLNPVAELDENNNLISLFVYGSKSHVPDYMIKSGVKYRIISDQLGSVRFVINTNNGTTAQEISYNEWGMVLSDSNPGLQPFGYAGGIYDSDTQLVRFGARDYDAQVGRWTAKDPILFAGGDTNLYRYTGNSPMNRIDPSGLDWIYDQDTGEFYQTDGKGNRLPGTGGTGYSGAPGHVNSPGSERIKNKGPIPRGRYRIEPPNSRRGPKTLPLTPLPSTNTFRRGGFLIHGDNGERNRSASEGCIILGPNIRDQVIKSGDNNLEVN